MNRLAKHPDWWRGAVIYQIYPRSFQDSNGDGIGDLAGIVQRLPHIAKLGAEAIWISPFFTSPMKDFGYDISDYRNVDPMFGTLADFDAVVEASHKLGLKVMIDLVLSHTSDQHPWFKESRASRSNPKSDWYVWADAKPDGTAPNNWLSIFGGPGWHWDARRCQYYQHNFLSAQPDLNFHNPAVQAALLDAAHFWLERGVDGFRLDTINFYFCDSALRDNPSLPHEERNSTIAPAVNPYNYQRHLHDKNQPENLDFLRQFRALIDRYDAAAVGEVGDAQRGLEILGEYTSGNSLMQMCYAFEFLGPEPLTARLVVDTFARLEKAAPQGWACWAFSNHDVVRHKTRWNLSDQAIKAHLITLLTLRGSVCLYQGEELGLTEADVAFDDLQDPYGIEFWPEFKGRDGCRTPMVWQADNQSGGFTTDKPWLPVSPAHLGRALSAQEADPTTLLHFYRRALAFRAGHPVLRLGAIDAMHATQGILSFTRKDGRETIWVAANLSDKAGAVVVPAGKWRALGVEIGAAAVATGRLALEAWQFALYRAS